MKKKNKIRKTLRNWHRDLGYFFIGLTLIYGVSGIILNLKDAEKDPAYKEIRFSEKIQGNLMPDELKEIWSLQIESEFKLNRIIPANNSYKLFLNSGTGYYIPATGELSFTTYKKRNLVKFINNIHYNSGKRFTWLVNIFAVCLIFLAISGGIILKGKYGFKKRGWWLILAGLAVPVIWYVLLY